MTVYKRCADFLREEFRDQTGKKLRSSHAHEIVAAYFGYRSAAALRAEASYPVDFIDAAAVMIPDLSKMARRYRKLEELPKKFWSPDTAAAKLSSYLQQSGDFSGEIWDTSDVAGYVRDYFIPENAMTIMDDLSSEMAETNAYFDGPEVDEVVVDWNDDGISLTVSGILEGESDQDKPFSGDSIKFSSVIVLDRIAGRTCFGKPSVETEGAVSNDWFDYED